MVPLHRILDVEDLTLELGGDEVLLLVADVCEEVFRPQRLSNLLVKILHILNQISQPLILVLQYYILELLIVLLLFLGSHGSVAHVQVAGVVAVHFAYTSYVLI